MTNWPVYEAGLRRRGDLTLWLDPTAIAGWAAPRRSTPGGQQRYSGLAIELVLTLRRRGSAFARRQPRVRASGCPVHLVLDSTGFELIGQGEWCAAKHGRARRRWMKLHIGVASTTGEIVAHVLTDGCADDAAQVPDLLRQPEGDITSLADLRTWSSRLALLPF